MLCHVKALVLEYQSFSLAVFAVKLFLLHSMSFASKAISVSKNSKRKVDGIIFVAFQPIQPCK